MWKWLRNLFKQDIRNLSQPPVRGTKDEMPDGDSIYATWPKDSGVYAAGSDPGVRSEFAVSYIVFVYGTPPFCRFRAVDAVDGSEQGYIEYALTFHKIAGVNARKTGMELKIPAYSLPRS